MITKEQKDEALKLIKQYTSEQRLKREELIPEVIEKVHKHTKDKNWVVYVKYDYNKEVFLELSNHEYDEDYGGEYDKYFDELTKKYGFEITANSGMYGK